MSLLNFGFQILGTTASSEPNAPSTSGLATEDAISTSSVPITNDPENDSDGAQAQPKKRKKKDSVRIYDPSYLAFGFICAGTKEMPLPMCVVCQKTFVNASIKPALCERHMKTVHPELVNKPIDYFVRLKSEVKSQSQSMKNHAQLELASIESSFAVAYEIAKAKKPFTIAEQLVQSCLSKVVEIILGPSALAKISAIPLSRNTIARRFSDMTRDVEKQLCSRLKMSGNFALQFDESTDIVGEAILIGFVRYIHDGKIVEDIFCFCSLPERTTGEEIFTAIKNKMEEYELDWSNVIGLCTDGAAAMTGVRKGLAQRISEVASTNFMASHCIIHREALASREMSPELNETLQLSVNMINNIKANALNSRMFSLICSEMGSDHDTLLLHTEVRWLSRGKVFSRLFELRRDLAAYFKKYIESKPKPREKGKKIPEKPREKIFLEKLNDDKWLSTLAYLADIFGFLNEMNLKLQGRNMNCFIFWNKIDAFQKQLLMWEQQIAQSDFTTFSLANELLSEDPTLAEYIQPIILNHLMQLISKFKAYFPANTDPRTSYLWIVNPFLNVNEPNLLTAMEKNQLLGTLHLFTFLFRSSTTTSHSYFSFS